MAKPTEKQQRFADEYLIDLNATRAYLTVYHSVKSEAAAAVNASKLLRNAKVAAYITEQQKERERRTQVTQDRVLLELAAIGFADIASFAKVEEHEIDVPTGQINDEGQPVTMRQRMQNVTLVNTDDVSPEKRGAIAGIKQGANGIEVKLNDKVKALELIGRHLGLFTDKVELSGDVNVSSKLNDILEQLNE